MKKKILSWLLAAAMMLPLIACSQGTENAPSSTAPDGSSESTAQQGASGTEEQEPVTLELWWPGSEAMQVLADGFVEYIEEENPYITMKEPLVISWNDYDTKMNVAFAGGTAPDIFGVGMNPLPNYVAGGNLLPVGDYLDESWDGWEDIPENVQECATWDGKFYGVMLCDLRPFMWRKDMFAEAGLDPDTPPQTKEELFEFSKKLTKYNEDGKVIQAGWQIQTNGYVDQTLWSVMLMHDLDYFWDENYDLDLLNPKMIESVEYCKSFIDEGLCNFEDAANFTSAFTNGLAAMSLNTACSELAQLDESFGLENIGVCVPPMTMGGANFMGGTIICANSKSENIDAVMDAWKTCASTRGCTLAGTTGFVPPRLSCEEDYVAQNPEAYGPTFDMLEVSKTYGPLNPYFADFRNLAIKPWIDQIYYGKVDIEEGLTRANEDYIQGRKDRDANS